MPAPRAAACAELRVTRTLLAACGRAVPSSRQAERGCSEEMGTIRAVLPHTGSSGGQERVCSPWHDVAAAAYKSSRDAVQLECGNTVLVGAEGRGPAFVTGHLFC